MFELPRKEDIVNHGIPSTPDDITDIVIKRSAILRMIA